jgi:hypothetical protein
MLAASWWATHKYPLLLRLLLLQLQLLLSKALCFACLCLNSAQQPLSHSWARTRHRLEPHHVMAAVAGGVAA